MHLELKSYCYTFGSSHAEELSLSLAHVTENLRVRRIKSFLCLGRNSLLRDVCRECPGMTNKRQRHKVCSEPHYSPEGAE